MRGMHSFEQQIEEAGQAAAALVEPGMQLGLGTGRTVARLVQALADRHVTGLRCVATSPDTERMARLFCLFCHKFVSDNSWRRLSERID